MSIKSVLCCCCENGRQRLDESGGSNVTKRSEENNATGQIEQIIVGQNGEVENNDGNEIGEVSGGASQSRNPRNKCALKPGHSHLDWVRLSNSKDLSGLGEKAGTLKVTHEELAKHKELGDSWLAINGKVYNVSSYFPYHPGGIEELQRGVGIDATKLFQEVHSWVNFETILKKCQIGRLVPSQQLEPFVVTAQDAKEETKSDEEVSETPSSTQNEPNGQNNEAAPPVRITNLPIDINRTEIDYSRQPQEESLPVHSFRSTHEDPDMELSTAQPFKKQHTAANQPLPRFDWVQKSNVICVSFSAKTFANPSVESWKCGKTVNVVIRFEEQEKTIVNEVRFKQEVQWPGVLRVIEEEGKVELTCKKVIEQPWINYGVLKQSSREGALLDQKRVDYVLTKKEEVAANVYLIELTREDGLLQYVPIGYHLRIFMPSEEGEDLSRSYTPIPEPKNFFPKFSNATYGDQKIFLLVKRYDEGKVSRYICDAEVGEVIQASRPIKSGLDLERLHDTNRCLMLAAGTGLTPMLSLMLFFKQRRTRRCKQLGVLYSNNHSDKIPFLQQFADLDSSFQKLDKDKNDIFFLRHIVSDEDTVEVNGVVQRGRITEDTIAQALSEVCRRKTMSDELSVFVCGPNSYNDACYRFLRNLNIRHHQIFVFEG